MNVSKEMKYTYFLMLILVLSFVINPFLKKTAANNIGANEYMIINHVLITLLIILYAVYLFYYNKCDLTCLKKFSKKQILFAVLAAATSIFGSIALIMLIQRDEVTFIIPNVQPIVIMLGALLGYFFFSESMGSYKVIGIILVVVGALFINYDKLRNIK